MADKKNTAGTAFGAGVVGAAFGAAVGATAVALADPKTRKKAIKKIGQAQKKTMKAVANLKAEMLNDDETENMDDSLSTKAE